MLWLTSIMKIYRQKYHTTANVALTMNFTPWLNFKTSYAYRGEHQRQTYHTPAYVADPKPNVTILIIAKPQDTGKNMYGKMY